MEEVSRPEFDNLVSEKDAIHKRMDLAAQNIRDDFKDLDTKLDEQSKNYVELLAPVSVMSEQVKTNEQNITKTNTEVSKAKTVAHDAKRYAQAAAPAAIKKTKKETESQIAKFKTDIHSPLASAHGKLVNRLWTIAGFVLIQAAAGIWWTSDLNTNHNIIKDKVKILEEKLDNLTKGK